MSFRDRAVIRLSRCLGRYFPDVRGKEFLLSRLSQRVKEWPHAVTMTTTQGLIFDLDLAHSTHRFFYYHGYYDKDVTSAMVRFLRPGDIAFDVGANCGFHSLLASRLVGANGRVYAFEPLPVAFGRLKHHIVLNSARNIVAEQMALGRTRAESFVNLFDGLPDTHASLISLPDVDDSFPCVVVPLDEFVNGCGRVESVDLIKIDVEGSELDVLKGAYRTIAEYRPVLLVEVNFLTSEAAGYTSGDVMDFLSGLGYGLRVLRGRKWKQAVLDDVRHGDNLCALHPSRHLTA